MFHHACWNGEKAVMRAAASKDAEAGTDENQTALKAMKKDDFAKYQRMIMSVVVEGPRTRELQARTREVVEAVTQYTSMKKERRHDVAKNSL